MAEYESSDSMLETNPEQRKAVEYGEGPLLVIAGPGSGKTRVITERIVYLLQQVPGLQPENVLALTYTDKAAAEMLARVRKARPDLEKLPRILTFHAFCFHVLSRRHFERVLLDEVDVWIFLRRRMEQLGLEHYRKLAEPGAFLHDLNDFFSRCQDELVEPEDFDSYTRQAERDFLAAACQWDPAERAEAQVELEKQKELARVFRQSRRMIEEAGCSSFGSLISETLQLWKREPEVLEQCRAQYRYILVDEFQDTNFAQVELLKQLVAFPHNITAVGDDDQAIYRFRGASHGQFQMFDRTFPDHETVYLDRNYRSTKRILRVADVLIGKNERYENKKPLQAGASEGEKICLLDSPDYPSEAAWIAAEVERLVKRGRGVGEIAVLYRAHGYRDQLVAEFRRRKIPFAIRGLSILATPIVRDLVAYLSVIQSPHDSISLTRVLLAPCWRFPEDLALPIRKQAAKARCSVYSAIQATEMTLFKDDVQLTGWPELKKLLRDLKQLSEHAPITAVFDELAKRLRLSFLPGDPDRRLAEAFRNFLQSWEKKSETRKLAEFREYFQYFVEAGGTIECPEPQSTTNAVQMMSVHAAKGLEFPVVFLISVASRRFPHSEQSPVIAFPDDLRKGPVPPSDIHLQEERRLFYVALTRARERLYVSSVRSGKKVSQFIDDLLSDSIVAAKDIERIEVPKSEREPGGPRAPETDTGQDAGSESRTWLAKLSRPAETTGQYNLFASGTGFVHGGAYVRPDLDLWVRQTPAGGLIGPDGKMRLSATAIETYRDCPLKFKFIYHRKIPTGPQAALTFGSLMHQSIRYYFELRKKTVPRYEEVRDYYLRSWNGLGFEDSYQEESYKRAGLEQLREFMERQSTIALDPESVSSEQHFSLDLGEIILEGRIDQINQINQTNPINQVNRRSAAVEGSEALSLVTATGVEHTCANPEPRARIGRRSQTRKLLPGSQFSLEDDDKAPANAGYADTTREVELIDYKTGRPRSQKDADKSLQLSVYALAASRELQIKPVRLTFYNLTNNQPVSTVRLPKDLDKAVEIIHDVGSKIRSLQFDPRPGFNCKYCEFVPICPAHEQGE